MKISFFKEGQTPINEDEIQDLIPNLFSLEDLNSFEAANISDARIWCLNNRILNDNNLFSLDFAIKLHKKMFNQTWKWAGNLRKSDKNIGCDSHLIREEYKKLQDDVTFWLENNKYSHKELAVIFHHRIVKIHLFPNGNGRHARLIADCIIKKYKGEKINWLKIDLFQQNQEEKIKKLRKDYILALRKADNLDYSGLFQILL